MNDEPREHDSISSPKEGLFSEISENVRTGRFGAEVVVEQIFRLGCRVEIFRKLRGDAFDIFRLKWLRTEHRADPGCESLEALVHLLIANRLKTIEGFPFKKNAWLDSIQPGVDISIGDLKS